MASAVLNFPKEINLLTEAYEPAADLSYYQYRFVLKSGGATGKLKITAPTTKGTLCLGVLLNAPEYANSVVGQVRELGVAPVKAAATISAGDEVCCAVDGRAQTAVSGDFVMGIAQNAATAATEIIGVRLLGGYYKA
jgi:hypothetical protein